MAPIERAETVVSPSPAGPTALAPPVPAAPAVPVVQAGGAPKGVRPMARAPDDPGPVSPDEEDEGADAIVFRPGRMA